MNFKPLIRNLGAIFASIERKILASIKIFLQKQNNNIKNTQETSGLGSSMERAWKSSFRLHNKTETEPNENWQVYVDPRKDCGHRTNRCLKFGGRTGE